MPMTAQWMYEHFLIETTMTVAGLVALTRLGAAFPDKRDILILGPLPVRTSTLFLAKVAALLGRTRSGGDRIEHLRRRSLAVIFSIEQRRFSRWVKSMACVLDHDPSRKHIFCLHHPCPSRAGGQSVFTATFPPSIGIFAGRRDLRAFW